MADPLYRQIAEDLRLRIESGELPAGAQLPTELELRDQYGNASRNTVRDAIKLLAARGLVLTQPGRGTFVVERFKPFIAPLNPDPNMVSRDEGEAYLEAMRQQGGEPKVGPPGVSVEPPADEVARELELGEGSSVVIRRQRRFVDDRPSSLQTTFYPMDFVSAGATRLLQPFEIQPGATKYLAQTLGIEQAGYRDRLTVRRPNSAEAGFFRFADAAAALVMVVHRTVYARDGKPIRFTVSVYPAYRNHFVIEFGKVPPMRAPVPAA